MIGIGVVGFGRWGANLARNFAAAGARIAAVSDPRPDRLASAMEQYRPNLTSKWRDLLGDPHVDAIAIATPAATHFEIARASLAAGRHTLVEKPLSLSADHARQLRDVARRSGLTLMVDHTYLYSDSISTVQQLIAGGNMGELLYYDAIRIGQAPPDREVGVLWDLAVHDIAIMIHIAGRLPTAVAVKGFAQLPDSPVCDAQLTLQFPGNFVGNAHVSWLSATKVRQTVIGTAHKVMFVDELKPNERLKICARDPAVAYSSKADVTALFDRPETDVWEPPHDGKETLEAVAREFLACVVSGRQPLSNGEAGLRTVEVLELAHASLARGGPLLSLRDAGVT